MKKARKVKDKDILAVERALLRAGRVARRIAAATNTPLIICENGKVVEKWVKV